jgi:hypothetical protein
VLHGDRKHADLEKARKKREHRSQIRERLAKKRSLPRVDGERDVRPNDAKLQFAGPKGVDIID